MTRRSRLIASIAALSVTSVAVGFIYLRGGSTPVEVRQAVDRFRRSTNVRGSAPTDAPPRPVRDEAKRGPTTSVQRARADDASREDTELTLRPHPRQGVYVYDTTGGDNVNVLGGSSHTYPARTTITVRHAGCGLIERWDALDERWDERETCRTTRGDLLKRFTSYHEFFRQADRRTYTCNGFAYPAAARPGDVWKNRCVSGSSIAEQTGHAVGFETLTVGTDRVRTLRVRIDTVLTGEQKGSGSHEVWGDLRTGLAIRERVRTDSDSTQPVIGKVHYHESYEIRLSSLKPRS